MKSWAIPVIMITIRRNPVLQLALPSLVENSGADYTINRIKKLIDYAFQHVDSVLFHIGTDNIRSQKAVEKLGGLKIGEVSVISNVPLNLPHFEYELKVENYKL